MEYEKLFKTQPVWKSIFSMAVPTVISIFVMILYNLADLFFIAQTGDEKMIAGVSVVTPLFSMAASIATMLGSGGSALIARALGAKKYEKALDYASVCICGSVVIGCILMVSIYFAKTPLLRYLGADDDFTSYASTYLSFCAAGVPFMLLSPSIGAVIRAEGKIKESMKGSLASSGLNIVLDALLIFVLKLGVAGAAIATVLSNIFTCGYFILRVLPKLELVKLHLKTILRSARANGIEIFSIIALGLPNALSGIMSSLAGTLSNRCLSVHGAGAIAAFSAAYKCNYMMCMIVMGICMGVQPLLAYNYGAQNTPRLKEATQKLGILAVGIGTVGAALCFALRGKILAVFLRSAAVYEQGLSMMPYLLAALPVMGIFYLGINFLQAAGKAKTATAIVVARQGLFLMPAIYILNRQFEMKGIAIAYPFADFVSSVLVALILLAQYQKLNDPKGRV